MQYNLEILNRLNEIKDDKDIKALSHAIFPGTHCPLFGVALTASYIENLAMLVVGTSECTYYTKNFSYHRQEGVDKVYSLVLKEKDVIFGADKKVKDGARHIMERENPSGIMIVTTCVPELIGEDYRGIVDELEEELSVPVFVVSTEHYKCNSHIPGMSRALSALIKVMKKQDANQSINILGHRQKGVMDTELVTLLNSKGIEINTIIPSKCNIKTIEIAPKARLNVVTDMIALDLAKKMEKKFNIPYIFFDKHLNKKILDENYKKLSEILNIDMFKELEEKKKEYDKYFNEGKEVLKNRTFIYGNTPMMAFETSEFLVELGMEPKLIQVRELYDIDIRWKDKILEKGHNPYITRIANIAPLREIYHTIGAQLYVGHENPMLLKSKGLIQMTFDEHAQKIGYELPIEILKSIISKFKKA